MIEKPLVVLHEIDEDGTVSCLLSPSEHVTSFEHYGMLISDLVRHVALAFNVSEDDVWEWVDIERQRPTTRIRKLS